jgi:hypothetical protein
MELPEAFADLTPLLEQWRLPDQRARMRALAGVGMAELRAFHDAMLPRVDAIVEHLDRFDTGELPGPEQALFELALTFAEVAHPVDLSWRTTEVSDLFPLEQVHLVGPSRAW